MTKESTQLTMRSKKQHIRLWFECLQICLSKSVYKQNLKKSTMFYKEWGNVESISFDEWWIKKKYLFEDSVVSEVSRVSSNPNTVTLSIPLNENVSTIVKEVKRIVEKHQIDRLEKMGLDPRNTKSKSLPNSKYKFTQKEIKGKFHYINLEIYKIFLDLNNPPINRDFLINVRKRFESRHRSKLSKNIIWIPQMRDFESTYKTNGDCEDIIRTVRRGIKSVEKTLMNVSNGMFP